MNKKWVTIGVLGVLVLGGGYWGYKHFTAKPAVSTNITAKAKMGDVSKAISATGTVIYPHATTLTFPTSNNSSSAGKIVELNVKAGDTVKQGEVLAKIDDTSLKATIQKDEANVESAEAALQAKMNSYNAQTRAQAAAALAQAQMALTTAKQNADPTYLANQVMLANQTVKQASDALAKAQQSGNESSIQSAQSALTQAMNSLTTAQNAQNGGAAQALAVAQANVTSAQYQVDQQAQGPSDTDLQPLQASIEIAKENLASDEATLANASIIAPFDAIVVDCPLQLGQDSNSSSIITVTPVGDKLEIDASVGQSDITQVKVGQNVDITLDSAPNNHISGTVTQVALQGTIASNVTTYTVKITVDQPTDLLRAGMNANVNIIIAQAKNVLTIPSEAVKTRGNESFVLVPLAPGASNANQGTQGNRGNQSAQSGSQSGQSGSQNSSSSSARSGMANASVRMVPVVTGLDDGTNVEIKSGLTEGQEVIIGTRSSSTTTNNSSGNRGGFGGGSNPGRAMHQLGG